MPTEDLIYNEYGDDQVITITTDLITTENIGEAKVNLIGKGTGDIVPCKNVRIISQSPVTVACNIPANLNPDDYDIEIIIPQIGKTYTIPSALQIKIAYTIYYNANDGTNAPADSTVNYPSSSYNMELSDSIPTRSGYKFLGWSENPNDTVATYKWYGGGPTPDGNMSWRPFNPNTVALTKERPTRKLYASWENNGNYVVSYSANGGSNAPAQFSTPIDSQEYSVTINTTTIPTNNGLGFAGYAESPTAETPTYIYNSVTNSFTPSVVSLYSDSKKSTVLYAIWETIDYSVSYVANGGSNIPSSESYSLKVASKDIAINTSKIPSRANYQFLGYAESATGDVVYAYNANSRTFTPSSFTLTAANPNKILYAVFTEIFTHSVSYSANGASVPSSRTITTTALTSSISVDTSVIPSKTSSNFLGYAESSTATTPDYVYNSANNTFTPADVTFGSTSTAKTLYAVFQDVYTYTINYYADQGTNVPESTIINTTDTSRNVNISTSIPSRTGHKFLGWDENPNATTPTYAYSSNTFSPAAVAFATQKRTYNLYAIWAEYNSFSLSYDLNYNAGASATVPPAEEEADTTAASKTYSINTTVIPTRSGYQFLGYATSNTASVPTYTYSSNTFTPNSITLTKTNNIVVLYAVWAKTYSLSYNANSGSGVPSSASAQATDASYSFAISNTTIPTRSGYKFLGYDTSSTATTPTYVYNSSNNSFTPASITLTESAASKTLYAIWAKIYTYTLSYNANQGSNVPNAKTYSGTETAHEFPIWATGDPIPTRSL